jgi:hypothetical protein
LIRPNCRRRTRAIIRKGRTEFPLMRAKALPGIRELDDWSGSARDAHWGKFRPSPKRIRGGVRSGSKASGVSSGVERRYLVVCQLSQSLCRRRFWGNRRPGRSLAGCPGRRHCASDCLGKSRYGSAATAAGVLREIRKAFRNETVKVIVRHSTHHVPLSHDCFQRLDTYSVK